MRQKIISEGVCRLCGKTFSKNGIRKHIVSCGKDAGIKQVFLMKAESGPFWVYFEIERTKKLADIDKFFRKLWVECCGHLSEFTIGGKGQKLEFVLEQGMHFAYEYDFGTTTELLVECVLAKTGKEGIHILARNNPLDIRCNECGNPAKFICSFCGDVFVCVGCSEKHACGEDAFLPIVNSPRMGMCGFTGDDCRLLHA